MRGAGGLMRSLAHARALPHPPGTAGACALRHRGRAVWLLSPLLAAASAVCLAAPPCAARRVAPCFGSLRLRGGGASAETVVAPPAVAEPQQGVAEMDEAVHVLSAFSPRRQRLVVRGVKKQPRECGLKLRPPKTAREKRVAKVRKGTAEPTVVVKKRRKKAIHEEPWRWQKRLTDVTGDTGLYRGRQIEVRKRTAEGNHILRVGFVGSRNSREAAAASLKAKREQHERLWELEDAVRVLKGKVAEAVAAHKGVDAVDALQRRLQKLEHAVIRVHIYTHIRRLVDSVMGSGGREKERGGGG